MLRQGVPTWHVLAFYSFSVQQNLIRKMPRKQAFLRFAFLTLIIIDKSFNVQASDKSTSASVAIVDEAAVDPTTPLSCDAPLPDGSCSVPTELWEDFEATEEWQEIKPNQAIPPVI